MMIANLLCRANWIKFAGRKYQSGHVIMIEASDGEYPKFAKIENIYISNSKILLSSTAYETVSILHTLPFLQS